MVCLLCALSYLSGILLLIYISKYDILVVFWNQQETKAENGVDLIAAGDLGFWAEAMRQLWRLPYRKLMQLVWMRRL